MTSEENINCRIVVDRQKQPLTSTGKCQPAKWFDFSQMSQQHCCLCISGTFIGQRFFSATSDEERKIKLTASRLICQDEREVPRLLLIPKRRFAIDPRLCPLRQLIDEFGEREFHRRRTKNTEISWPPVRGGGEKQRTDQSRPLANGINRYRNVFILDVCFTLFHFLLLRRERRETVGWPGYPRSVKKLRISIFLDMSFSLALFFVAIDRLFLVFRNEFDRRARWTPKDPRLNIRRDVVYSSRMNRINHWNEEKQQKFPSTVVNKGYKTNWRENRRQCYTSVDNWSNVVDSSRWTSSQNNEGPRSARKTSIDDEPEGKDLEQDLPEWEVPFEPGQPGCISRRHQRRHPSSLVSRIDGNVRSVDPRIARDECHWRHEQVYNPPRSTLVAGWKTFLREDRLHRIVDWAPCWLRMSRSIDWTEGMTRVYPQDRLESVEFERSKERSRSTSPVSHAWSTNRCFAMFDIHIPNHNHSVHRIYSDRRSEDHGSLLHLLLQDRRFPEASRRHRHFRWAEQRRSCFVFFLLKRDRSSVWTRHFCIKAREITPINLHIHRQLSKELSIEWTKRNCRSSTRQSFNSSSREWLRKPSIPRSIDLIKRVNTKTNDQSALKIFDSRQRIVNPRTHPTRSRHRARKRYLTSIITLLRRSFSDIVSMFDICSLTRPPMKNHWLQVETKTPLFAVSTFGEIKSVMEKESTEVYSTDLRREKVLDEILIVKEKPFIGETPCRLLLLAQLNFLHQQFIHLWTNLTGYLLKTTEKNCHRCSRWVEHTRAMERMFSESRLPPPSLFMYAIVLDGLIP